MPPFGSEYTNILSLQSFTKNKIMSRVGVPWEIITGFGLDDWIY
jgi:hypothetical protein